MSTLYVFKTKKAEEAEWLKIIYSGGWLATSKKYILVLLSQYAVVIVDHPFFQAFLHSLLLAIPARGW